MSQLLIVANNNCENDWVCVCVCVCVYIYIYIVFHYGHGKGDNLGCVRLNIIIISLLKEFGSARLRPLSVKRPQPHNTNL